MKNTIVLIFLLALIHATGFSQKVGLVLSGGGAKGLAHIGVIRALEENNIPISCIAGTSMGAIIGGLYAAGYTTREMEDIFKSEDFKNWSNGIIPSRYKPYYKKFDENSSLYDLDFFKNIENLKFLLPVKIISPGQMDLAFLQLFSPASAKSENDFNKLFIPFRCVATDLYRNQLVVLNKGDLGSAIRASMSLPLYFKPVEIDSTLLFDGGLMNNFPVEVMVNEFHPDLIIGSAVEFENKKIMENNLFNQIEKMITKKTIYHVPDSLGFTIISPVNQVGLFDFDRVDSTIKVGHESAMKMMAQIKSTLAFGTNLRDMNRERMEYRQKLTPLVFRKAEITGVDPHLKQYLIQSLFQNEKTISFDGLKSNYYSILAENRLKSIQPHAIYNRDSGYYDLYLKTEPQRPFSVAIGGYFSLTDVNEGFLGIRYRIYSAKPINIHSNIQFGRYYTSFLLGPRIEFSNKKPFSLDLIFNTSMLNYFTGSSELFHGNKSCFITRNENKMGLIFNFPIKVNSKWEAGLTYSNKEDRYFQENQFSRTDTSDETIFNSGNVFTRFEFGELNKKQYPTEGQYFNFTTMFTYGRESEIPGSLNPLSSRYNNIHTFLTTHLNYDKYFPVASNFRIGLELDSYFTTKKFFHNYTSTLLAANTFSPTVNSTIRFLPYLRSDNFVAGGLKFIIPVKIVSPLTHLRLEGYYFQPLRQISPDANHRPYYLEGYFTSHRFFGSGGFVIHTLFGPASVLLNVYDEGDPKFFLQASFGYLLNNRKD